MTKELTKKMLIDMGVEVREIDGKFHVFRLSKKGKSMCWGEIKVSYNIHFHKYSGKTKTYPIVVFTHQNKTRSYVLSRVIYAYCIGDIPAGYDVDHIDNDPFNNSLENLQLLTRKENNAKRHRDNDYVQPNQHKKGEEDGTK